MSSPVVLITGALTGIGRATALAFAQEGARVVVSGRHDDEGQKLAKELRDLVHSTPVLGGEVPARAECLLDEFERRGPGLGASGRTRP